MKTKMLIRQMSSPKSEVIYEKSSSENLSREVRKGEIKKDEQLVPKSKNKENFEVNIVGAKNNVCCECRGLSVASSPETGVNVTDVTDRVSLPATSSKINTCGRDLSSKGREKEK